MERNLYFENHINNIQKDIFLFAYNNHYQINDFISFYMKSGLRKEMDKKYTSWHNQPAERIFEEIVSEYNNINKVNKETISKAAVEWLGFFYSKWHFLTGESSKSIVKFLPPNEGLKNYYTLHQLDESEAIMRCKRLYNLSRNKHRKNEDKNSGESKMRYENPIYYSFLAQRLYYKLYKNEEFKNPKYIGDLGEYDFVDDSYSIGLKGDAIFLDDSIKILEKFEKANANAYRYSKKSDSSIYFCFVFSKYYEEDNDEKLLLDITEIKNKYPLYKRQFDYLYFYLLGEIYEITPSNEVYIYSMPLSKRERQGIINKMEELGL